MEKTEYIAPKARVLEIDAAAPIAQSYGDPGKAGNSIFEQPVDNW